MGNDRKKVIIGGGHISGCGFMMVPDEIFNFSNVALAVSSVSEGGGQDETGIIVVLLKRGEAFKTNKLGGEDGIKNVFWVEGSSM